MMLSESGGAERLIPLGLEVDPKFTLDHPTGFPLSSDCLVSTTNRTPCPLLKT